MQGHFWHLSLTQLFMLFHMVASVLLSMVAFSTIFLLVKILQQPIRIFEKSGYWSCHGEENACYHVKEHKKLGQKVVSKVTLHFVWGHLSKKQTVVPLSGWLNLEFNFRLETCEDYFQTLQSFVFNLKLSFWDGGLLILMDVCFNVYMWCFCDWPLLGVVGDGSARRWTETPLRTFFISQNKRHIIFPQSFRSKERVKNHSSN